MNTETESDVLDDPAFVRAMALATVRALIETGDAEQRREIRELLFAGFEEGE